MTLSFRALAAVPLLLLAACREDRDAAGPPPERLAPADGGVLEGTVAGVSRDRLRILPPGEGSEPVSLELEPGIPITVDGRVTAWSRIPEGASVRAAWMVEGGRPVALRIDATSPPGAFADPGPERPRRAP